MVQVSKKAGVTAWTGAWRLPTGCSAGLRCTYAALFWCAATTG
jgi:hypothetical protein